MKAELYNENGVHGVKINGKVFSFAATRSFRPEGRILHDFSNHGIKFFNIFPSGIMTALVKRTVPYSVFGPVWVGENEYNWDNLRAQCNEFFNNISDDTYVSISVHLDPPQWFIDSHPGMVDHWEQMIQNLGSEEWKTAATNYMYALIDKMDEWYPDRVYAVFLLCGGTTEWYSYHANEVIEKPTEIQQKAFRKYMNDESVSIPSVETLHHAADGVIRHPIEDKAAIDYWKFTNEIVPDTIMYFARKAKEHTKGTKLVGLFNIQCYGTSLDWAVRMSYVNMDKLCACPDIDMFFCPASYIARKLESTSAIRVPVDTIGLCDKLFVHEIDSSTHLLKKKAEASGDAALQHAVGRDEAFTCTSDTKMYIRRETGMVLAKGQGYWWFDMFSGYYDDPELMDELSRIHALQDLVLSRGRKNVSEVIEMIDKNSALILKTDTHYPMLEHQTPLLNLAGAPWDMGDTNDLFNEKFDFDRYKLYILPTLFAPTKKVQDMICKLRESGKSMLFQHAPGYVTENGFSEENMEKLTGIKLHKCELEDNTVVGINGFENISNTFTNQTVPGDIWRTGQPVVQIKPAFYAENLDVVFAVFKENGLPAAGIKYRENGGVDAFCAVSPIPTEFVSEIYKYVGVFKYTDKFDPIYTSDKFECAYSYNGGTRKLFRPKKSMLTDYFTGEKFEVGPEGTDVEFMPHETKMLLVDEM